MAMASDTQESMDIFQVSENYHQVQIFLYVFCEHTKLNNC